MAPSETTIQFTSKPSDNGQQEQHNRGIVFVGTKDLLKRHLSELFSQVIVEIDGRIASTLSESQSLLAFLLDQASCSKLSGGHAFTLLPKKGAEGEFVRISFVLVPSEASRHNSPYRADIVQDKLESAVVALNSGQEAAVTHYNVVFAFSTPAATTPADLEGIIHGYGGAVARAFPIYSRKSSSSSSSISIQTSFFLERSEESELAPAVENDQILHRLDYTTKAIRLAAAMVDAPCSEMHTTAFVEQVNAAVTQVQQELSQVEGENRSSWLSLEVISGADLQREGFGGIFNVGKAAVHPPALACLKWRPPSASKSNVWVGKGIVYDTGGLSMKDRNSMIGMKRDMGGAAAIFQAFVASVRANYPHNLTALLCLAENAVGPESMRPDDIITLKSGLTVEVNNTDAEGRLVLADGVSYATGMNPDVILDMCTLTGAQGIATGKRHAAIVTNQEDLELQTIQAGKLCGDLVYPLPYCPEFFSSEFSSEMADMKNSVKDRTNAQSSCAAQFIANHLGDYKNGWLHVDMAYPVHKGERATGYGVLLLFQLFVVPSFYQ